VSNLSISVIFAYLAGIYNCSLPRSLPAHSAHLPDFGLILAAHRAHRVSSLVSTVSFGQVTACFVHTFRLKTRATEAALFSPVFVHTFTQCISRVFRSFWRGVFRLAFLQCTQAPPS